MVMHTELVLHHTYKRMNTTIDVFKENDLWWWNGGNQSYPSYKLIVIQPCCGYGILLVICQQSIIFTVSLRSCGAHVDRACAPCPAYQIRQYDYIMLHRLFFLTTSTRLYVSIFDSPQSPWHWTVHGQCVALFDAYYYWSWWLVLTTIICTT